MSRCNLILGKGPGRGGSVKPNGSPSALTLTVDSDTAISGSFTIGSTNHDGHYAEFATSLAGPYTRATNPEAVMTGTKNTFTITGLTANTLYYVKIVAYKGSQESTASETVSEYTWTSQFAAVYAAFTNKPTASVAAAMNTYCKSLVDAGIWSKFDRLFILSTHTNDNGEALLDWINPSRSVSLSQTGTLGLPTFIPFEGFTGTRDGGANNNGGYISTGYNPYSGGINYTRNSAAFGLYVRKYDISNPQGANYMGSATGVNCIVGNNAAGNQRATCNSSGDFANITKVTNGIISIVREDSNTLRHWLNATDKGSRTIASASINNAIFNIMQSEEGRKSNIQVSMAYFSSALLQADITILFNAFETYQKSNGKELFYLSSTFLGASITAFGDSTTLQGSNIGGWVALMDDGYETTTNNMGWGARDLRDILSQERIETVPSDTDLILISGGNINTMGTIADSDPTVSLYGALNNAVRWFKTNRPTAKIVLIAPPDRINQEQNMSDQAVMYRAVAAAEGVGLCDMYVLSGFTQANINNYTIDGIHLNLAGNAIWYSVLSNYLNTNY